MTQILFGHFEKYLCRIDREPMTECRYCGNSDDTAQYTYEVFTAFEMSRRRLMTFVGWNLSLLAMIKAMVGNKMARNAMLAFCRNVMSQKQTAEQERERQRRSAFVIRRRRARRARPRN